MTFTFSNDVYKDGDVRISSPKNLNLRVYGWDYLEVMYFDIDGHVVTVDAISEFRRPRDTDDSVTVISGLVDLIGNPVVIPDGEGGFKSGTIVLEDLNGEEIVADIEAVKYDYDYWSGDIPNIAAVGQATYLGEDYYFMALYAERALWMALSKTDYQSRWDSNGVYSSGERVYDIHSVNSYDFPIFWQ